MKGTSNFYNYISFIYPVINVFLQSNKKALYKAVNQLPPGRLLDVGIGYGYDFKYYKNTHNLIGIDQAINMLTKAKRISHPNIQYRYMAAEKLEFESEHFDYVVLSHVVATFKNLDLVMSEVERVVKPGGRVLVLNHFTPNNSLKWLDKCFNIVAKQFRFVSDFKFESNKSFKRFELIEEVEVGYFGYFRLLIFTK